MGKNKNKSVPSLFEGLFPIHLGVGLFPIHLGVGLFPTHLGVGLMSLNVLV